MGSINWSIKGYFTQLALIGSRYFLPAGGSESALRVSMCTERCTHYGEDDKEEIISGILGCVRFILIKGLVNSRNNRPGDASYPFIWNQK